MHNYPGMPIGEFAIRAGPMMASTDTIDIDIEGVGGHAAWPHLGVDTVLVGAQIVNQLQSIVARNVDPLQAAVISICMFQAGTRRQRHPADRQAARHRAHALAEGARPAAEARARSGRGHGDAPTAPRRSSPTRPVIRCW